MVDAGADSSRDIELAALRDRIAALESRRQFGRTLLLIGVAFAVVVSLLPTQPDKTWLWAMDGVIFVAAAAQIDWAHRRLRAALREVPLDALVDDQSRPG